MGEGTDQNIYEYVEWYLAIKLSIYYIWWQSLPEKYKTKMLTFSLTGKEPQQTVFAFLRKIRPKHKNKHTHVCNEFGWHLNTIFHSEIEFKVLSFSSNSI